METMILREFTVKYKSRKKIKGCNKITQPREVWEIFKDLIGDEMQETMIALYLDNKNQPCGVKADKEIVLSWKTVSKGTVSETILHPREVFVGALECYASAVILIHNHPSGVLTPSKEDISITKRVVDAGKIVGIAVVDHVIISKDSYLSLKEEGYM